MTNPAAKGERFLAVSDGNLSFLEMARVLKARMGTAARRVPTRELPDWVLRLVALADPQVRHVIPDLGKVRTTTNAKVRRVLGWVRRSNEDAIVATAESLLRLGLLGNASKAL